MQVKGRHTAAKLRNTRFRWRPERAAFLKEPKWACHLYRMRQENKHIHKAKEECTATKERARSSLKTPDALEKFSPHLSTAHMKQIKNHGCLQIFSVFLQEFHQKLRPSGCKVTMPLVDNAGCGTNSPEELTNINLIFLPPNMPGRSQPPDAGIIWATKALYWAFLVHHYLHCVEKQQPQRVDLYWCLREHKFAWHAVSGESVANCWCHIGILPAHD